MLTYATRRTCKHLTTVCSIFMVAEKAFLNERYLAKTYIATMPLWRRRALLQLKGTRVELVIFATLGDKFIVAARLNNTSVLQDDDGIGIANR